MMGVVKMEVNKTEQVPLLFHPSVFSALGEDMVTSDTVAIAELVKNSYDAFAFNVLIKFEKDEKGQNQIVVEDDGFGMTKDIIQNAWATVATPYKRKNPVAKRIINGKEEIRVVSGNKGLGRCSAARLGDEMKMITKHKNGECIQAIFDWTALNNIESVSDALMTLEYLNGNKFINNESKTGTIIEIKNLKSSWNESKITLLKNELSRLITPFEEVRNFSIKILFSDTNAPVDVQPLDFINHPIYKISGDVDKTGKINWNYHFFDGKTKRDLDGNIEWTINNHSQFDEFQDYCCGPFSFEIRAWELNSDSLDELSGRFNLGKRIIRNCIGDYKGISVYRDKVLVLPKTDTSRDWLGLDARRISQIGRRLSTKQIIGIVNISNDYNPDIKDTTDREKLVDNIQYRQFLEEIYTIIDKLQNERLKDKKENFKQADLTDIIAPLSSKGLVNQVKEAVSKGKNPEEILDYVKEYDESNSAQLELLNNRLLYYAQTASLGSIAIVIMHELLTGLTVIKRFLNKSKHYVENYDSRTKEYLNDAEKSHLRVTEVTKSFAPLYRRDLRKKENTCDLKEVINNSISLIKAQKNSKDISFEYDIPDDIIISMHTSELQTVFINLIDNACFWIQASKKEDKKIKISITENAINKRISVSISDTGCGVAKEEAEKIFSPGITSKPHGIGMGLVIVSELLNNYDGKIATAIPGDLGGATFIFDIPRKG